LLVKTFNNAGEKPGNGAIVICRQCGEVLSRKKRKRENAGGKLKPAAIKVYSYVPYSSTYESDSEASP